MKDLEIVLKSIKNKQLLPIYFLHGEEPYYINIAVKSFEQDLLSEEEKAFNQTVVYGKDTSFGEIVSLACQYPMMGDMQLIVVKEAQDLKTAEADIQAFEAYVENPILSTVLVFAHPYKKLDARKKYTKALDKKNMLFYSEPVKDYNLPKWIQQECEKLGIKTTPNVAPILSEYLGNDLSRIANELHKLKLILKEGEVLDEKTIESHIGISKEFNVFELQKALGHKNIEQAFKIAYYMGKNPKSHPLVLVVGNLFNFFTNIILYHTLLGKSPQQMAAEMGVNPFFLKDYAEAARLYPLKHATRVVSVLREIDMKSKGLGANQTPDSELLKELVYKIINIDKSKN